MRIYCEVCEMVEQAKLDCKFCPYCGAEYGYDISKLFEMEEQRYRLSFRLKGAYFILAVIVWVGAFYSVPKAVIEHWFSPIIWIVSFAACNFLCWRGVENTMIRPKFPVLYDIYDKGYIR